MLDGSRSACDWQRDAGLAGAGADRHRAHADGRAQRLGAQQQRQLSSTPTRRSASTASRRWSATPRRRSACAPAPGLSEMPELLSRGQGHAPRRCSSSSSANRNFMAERGAARPAGRLRRPRRRPAPRSRDGCAGAARLGPHATTSTPAAPTCSASSGAPRADRPACTACPSTRRSRWPRRPG
ncbi:MAG: hypothetical protein MZW92_36770 [Comamonadaceae bacterium]|nr:hypothetical protein [Comamonadaceae bacterium]